MGFSLKISQKNDKCKKIEKNVLHKKIKTVIYASVVTAKTVKFIKKTDKTICVGTGIRSLEKKAKRLMKVAEQKKAKSNSAGARKN